MRMNRKLALLIVLVAGTAGLSGCRGDRCGEGQSLRGNSCINIPDAGPEIGPDVGPADDAGDAGQALGTECEKAGGGSDLYQCS